MIDTKNGWFFRQLTRQEREACASYGLDCKEWVHLDNKNRYEIQIGNINTGEKKVINKYRKVKKGEKHSWQM